MKEHMATHVRKNKSPIYRKATNQVMNELKKIFESNRKELQKEANHMIDRLEKDYRIVIASSEMIEASQVAREHIRSVLVEVDAQFKEVDCPEPMEVDTAQPPEGEPQQLPDASMAGVGVTPGETHGESHGESPGESPGEAVDAGPTGEAGAMETTL